MWLYLLTGFTAVLFIPYATIILFYRKWFLQLKIFSIPVTFRPQEKFSVIIPARNEEENISACLHSILSQNYPPSLFEIIVINDYSTDKTASVVEELQHQYSNLKLVNLSNEMVGKSLNAYKKKAIEIGIGYSSGDWIITTDADCIVKKNWISCFAALIQQQQPVFVAAPVNFKNEGTILSTFQCIDFATMQGITAASVSVGFHSMCNGANLAYRKDVFYKVNGFTGIDNIASGDDMLLMNKIKRQYPSKIAFLFSKDAVVSTLPMPDWKSFFNQRIRWASKADQYKDKSILGVLVLVYLYNLALFVMPFLAFIQLKILLYWLLLLTAKIIVELLFIAPVMRFFGQPYLWQFPLFQPLHIMYMVIAGWLGKFGKYQWKGRKVK